ncbi:MAG TPA: pyridoxal-phosphate dependent enzyme [Solimonas sp.]|nr:pyridoxal-phosphate dependent enzyme [Solimonas sp.]
MNPYPLFEACPQLGAEFPVAHLLAAPTPIEPMGEGLFLKRDDLTAADYGGNKIRKLDFLLADAQRRGARELLGFGYAGSNFVAATAWHGRKLGLHTIGLLLPQVNAPYVTDNLAVGLAAGAELRQLDTSGAIVRAALWRSARSLLRHGRAPRWIPPGGSSPVGVLGFVNAALELKRQVDAGLAPAPDSIYVAFSSMGTVAGLALGLELAGLHSRIVAVQVVDAHFASAGKLAQLIGRSRGLLGRFAPQLRSAGADRVEIRTEFFGSEYARPTTQASAAMHRFASVTGARADSAYSGKALACFYADLDGGLLRGRSTLFWHTFNAHGSPAGVSHPAPDNVPLSLRRYFSS